jgi:hypothetical protein
MLKDKKTIILASILLVILLSLIVVPKISQGASSATKVIEKGSEFTAGTYEISMSSQTDSAGSTFTNPTYKITGLTTGPQHLLSFSYDNNGQVVNLENVIYIDFDSNTAYIKAAPVMNFLSGTYGIISNTTDIEEKWLTMPLPELNNQDANYIEELRSALTNSMLAFVKSESFVKDGSSFVMNKGTGEEFAALITSVTDILTSNKDSISTNVYNLWSQFTPAKYEKYFNNADLKVFSNPKIEAVNNKFDKIVSSLSALASDIANSDKSYCSLTLSCTDKFQQELAFCIPQEDALKTSVISISLSNNDNVEIVPPETNSVISIDKSEVHLQNLFESIYTVVTSDTETATQEWYIPKYSTVVSDNVLICTRENELFTESIFYTISNDALTSVAVEAKAADEKTCNALLDYYKTQGYQVTKQESVLGAFEISLIASDATIKEQYSNVVDMNTLQSALS